jgi:DNA primase
LISDDVVERVKAAADIVQFISETVPLKRTGTDYRGPCPFHNGKGPNFSVSPKRGSYHCFVCHESGDVFTFARKRLGLDWPSAVKHVGERFGVEVIDAPSREHVPDKNEPNWEVLATAAEWFRERLQDDQVGREAREYLDSRGLDVVARERFGIGFAPRDPQLLRRHLHTLGFDDSRLLEAGLLVSPEGGAEPRLRFRERVMFPIIDESGHHVGFGGRVIGNKEPKYLNSPESGVFQKRRTLYGMHTARNAIRRASRAIVVEGYMDAIRLALAGIEEVVAPLGTALTEEQAELLVRYTREVYLLYDNDDAGLKATFRSGQELLRNRADVRVVTLPPGPDGKDPDSFIQAFGVAALEAQITQAIDLFDRQIQIIERRGWFADIKGRRTAIDKLLPTIRAARDPLVHDLYLTRLAEVAHVDKETLATEADQPVAMGGRRGKVQPASPEADVAGEAPDAQPQPQQEYLPPSNAADKGKWKGRRGRNDGPQWHSNHATPRVTRDEPLERSLIQLMLGDRSLVERFAERYSADELRNDHYRGIFSALMQGHPDDDYEVIAERVPDHALATYRELINGADANLAEGLDVELCFARFEARAIQDRIAEIRMEIGSGTAEMKNALLRERLALETELRRLIPVRSVRSEQRRS